MKKTKPSKCQVCGTLYTKARPFQKVCDSGGTYECAKTLGQKVAEQKAKKDLAIKKREWNIEKRQRKEKAKTISEWRQTCQSACNEYIRARDVGKECISCDTILEDGHMDAGHYRSVGSAHHMRYVLNNIHGQCRKCNYYLGSNAINYRIKLVDRIGLEAVEALEADQTLRKYTIDNLKELTEFFRGLLKSLNQSRIA